MSPNWTAEYEALKQRAVTDGYFYWNKEESAGGIIREDHCIYSRDAGEIVGRSYSEQWAWVYAFRALGWLPQDAK